MDREVIIYIVFAIIYFVVRMLKKKQQPPDATERDFEQETGQGGQPTSERPVSFEDLLRELTGQKQPQQAPPPPPEETRAPARNQRRDFQFPSDGDNYEDVQEEWEDKEVAVLKEGSTTRVFADEESKRIYEKSISQVKNQEDELEKQLERAKSRFKEFEIQEEQTSAVREEIVEMLQSSEGAKKAIILSEILNRKYWDLPTYRLSH